MNSNYAFLSVFFFMSYNYFYYEAPMLRRQMIALLFFSLILFSIMDHDLTQLQKSFLSLLFTGCLIISHYSMSWIFIIIILITYLILLVVENIKFKKEDNNFHSTFNYNPKLGSLNCGSYLLLITAFSIAWAIYVSSSSGLLSVLRIADIAQNSIISFFEPSTRDSTVYAALGYGFLSLPMWAKIYRLLIYISFFLIFVGYLKAVLGSSNLQKEHISLGTAAIIVLSLFILIPSLSNSNIHSGRLYFITLFVLSPFCIIGAKTCYDLLLKFTTFVYHKNSFFHRDIIFFIIFLIFISSYYLYNIGFIFAINGFMQEDIYIEKIPRSESLSYGKIDTGYHTEKEFIAAKMLAARIRYEDTIYVDSPIGEDLVTAWHKNILRISNKTDQFSESNYMFLREWNLKRNEFIILGDMNKTDYIQFDASLIRTKNKIYTNAGAVLLGPD